MKRELRRKAVMHGYHHRLLAIDVENNPDTGDFICAGIFGEYRKRTSKWILGKPRVVYESVSVEKYIKTQAEFDDFLLSLKPNSCLLIFFNLDYDKYYLNNVIADFRIKKDGSFDLPLLKNGNRTITVRLKNNIRCLDLCNHVDGSLKQWIKYLDMPNKYGVNKVSLNNLYERVMNDCKATFYLGKFIQDFYYKECGIPIQLTVGASALRLFTNKFFTDFWTRDVDFLSDFERLSYYGGRAELFKRGKFKIFNYDVNSMYLSIMHDCLLPDVSTAKYIENGKGYLKHFNDYLGIYRCRVRTPDKLYAPLLPVRLDKKLKFPLGEFDGVWCSVELKKAIEKGYKILKVYDYIYYRQSKYYFKEFAEFVWRKRKEYKAKNNQGMNLMIKKIGNSLYGKFAQRNSNDYFGKISDISELPDTCEFFDFHGELWVKIKGDLTPAAFEFPAISSFITSYARLLLYSGIEHNEKSLVYCDTDSLKLTAPAVGVLVGGELGEFGFEGKSDYEFFKPKFFDEKTPNKEFDIAKLNTDSSEKSLTGFKCKGVPKRAKFGCPVCKIPIDDNKKPCSVCGYISYNSVCFIFKKPLREREAIRRKMAPNIWVDMIKVATFNDDKRVWHKDGNSEPIKI